jgi:hypothetical protein
MDSNKMENGKIYIIVDGFHNTFYIGRFDYFKLKKANVKGSIVIKDVISILDHVYNGKMLFFDEMKEISDSHLVAKELTGPFGTAYISIVQSIKYFMLVAEKSYGLFKTINDMKAENI